MGVKNGALMLPTPLAEKLAERMPLDPTLPEYPAGMAKVIAPDVDPFGHVLPGVLQNVEPGMEGS